MPLLTTSGFNKIGKSTENEIGQSCLQELLLTNS